MKDLETVLRERMAEFTKQEDHDSRFVTLVCYASGYEPGVKLYEAVSLINRLLAERE